MRRHPEERSITANGDAEAADAGAGTTAVLNALSRRLAGGKLKWIASLAPIVFFVSWEYLWHFRGHEQINAQPTLFMSIVVGVALVGSLLVWGQLHLLDRAQRLLRGQNRELSRRTVALEALYDLGTRLSALHDTDTVKETAVQRAQQLLGADTAGLALLHEPSKTVRWELLLGSRAERHETLNTQLGQCIAGEVIQSGEPLILENVDPQAAELPGARHFLAVEALRAALVVPVRVAGKPIGAMLVGHRVPYTFQLNDLKLLLSLANQVATAINNARLYERLAAYSVIEERERLAREMHDGLAQLLGHVTARVNAALSVLGQGRPEAAAQHLEQLSEVAQDGYVEVRQCILGLRTKPAADRGFVQTLGAYVERFGEQELIAVHFQAPATEQRVAGLPPALEVQAIRIVQEALNNVRRHARAGEVWVSIDDESEGMAITVRDDGNGFDLQRVAEQHSHFGLATMQERAEGVGGTFRVDTQPGDGTLVSVWLPVKAAA